MIGTEGMKVLVVNPGSTTTKVAIYHDETLAFSHEISYSMADLAPYPTVMDQRERREADVRELLASQHLAADFDAVVGRGGLVGPVRPGGYFVDEGFCDVITHRPLLEHASNLGGPLAARLASSFGKPGCLALVYDPVTIDEMDDVCRITGVPGIERMSIGHHLNMRAVARKLAAQLGQPYQQLRVIVAHLGGGSSVSAIAGGQVVDLVSDDEIQFSAERSGGIPVKEVLKLAQLTAPAQLKRDLRQHAGLAGLLGTTDLQKVDVRIADGDRWAMLVHDALALQIAKTIATLAVSLSGRLDAIALTGGMAHSQRLVAAITARAGWIGPISCFPGEFEMEALAYGALRILAGSEQAQRVTDCLTAGLSRIQQLAANSRTNL